MKKGFVILSILLGFVLIASISYNISLYQENKALTAKQDSLYTLSEAQKVFKENGLKLIDDVTVSIQDVKDYAAKYGINLPESRNPFNINGLNPLIVYYLALQCNRLFQPSNGFRKHCQSCNRKSKQE